MRSDRVFSSAAALVIGVLGCGRDVESPTGPTSAGEPALATSAAALPFSQLSGSGFNSCGVTTDSRAFCWGYNYGGELGDGTTTLRLTPVAVAGDHQFARSARTATTPAPSPRMTEPT